MVEVPLELQEDQISTEDEKMSKRLFNAVPPLKASHERTKSTKTICIHLKLSRSLWVVWMLCFDLVEMKVFVLDWVQKSRFQLNPPASFQVQTLNSWSMNFNETFMAKKMVMTAGLTIISFLSLCSLKEPHSGIIEHIGVFMVQYKHFRLMWISFVFFSLVFKAFKVISINRTSGSLEFSSFWA